MEIITSGNRMKNDGSVIFDCLNCGCRFSAKPDEYHQESSWHDSGITYTVYTYSNFYKTRYYANCPECHRMCCKELPSRTITTDSITIHTSNSNNTDGTYTANG